MLDNISCQYYHLPMLDIQSKYHDEYAPRGRAHRLGVVAHPLLQKSNPKETS